MYSEIKNTMSSPNSNCSGLMRKMDRRSVNGRRSRSCSVTCSSDPVSLRIFLARRPRMVGAYVSGTVKVMSTHTMKARMSWIQYSHLHPAASDR